MTVSNVGVNIAEKATLIWNVADMLRGPFKPHKYGLVILPMTVVKRFHDCLLPNHAKTLETYEKFKHLEVVNGFLTRASGYQFYNTSKYTFETLLADPENIEATSVTTFPASLPTYRTCWLAASYQLFSTFIQNRSFQGNRRLFISRISSPK